MKNIFVRSTGIHLLLYLMKFCAYVYEFMQI